MELLVGVLLSSAVVNVALLIWFAREDHVKVHWPPRLREGLGTQRSNSSLDDFAPSRRRTLVVAGEHAGDGDGRGSQALLAPLVPIARAPLSETLPRELAEFLAIPAAIAPHVEGFDIKPTGNGSDPVTQTAESGNGHGAAAIGLVAIGLAPTGHPASGDPATAGGGSAGLPLDALTGLEGPTSWSRIIAIENARLLRHRRPVTVVMAEVEGLRRLTDRLGEEPADRLLPVIGDALRREARSSDWVARVGAGRFAAFLPETDEIQAINYVERIRLVCEPWLASSAVPLRLAIGWSSPAASSDLEFALERAEERMHLDRRMPGRSVQQSRIASARVVSLPAIGADGTDGAPESAAEVPPAETGRWSNRRRREIALESTARDESEEISGAISHPSTLARAHGRPRRTKDEPPGGPAAGMGWGQ